MAGALYRAEVDHAPWPLQRAEVELHENAVAEPQGLAHTAGPPALVHFSRSLDVRVWPLERI